MIYLLLIALTPFFIILNGYVFQHLWNWFLVPFVGFPSLTLIAAIGVSMTISFVTYQFIPTSNNKEASEVLSETIAYIITKPLMALLVGWIVTLFM